MRVFQPAVPFLILNPEFQIPLSIYCWVQAAFCQFLSPLLNNLLADQIIDAVFICGAALKFAAKSFHAFLQSIFIIAVFVSSVFLLDWQLAIYSNFLIPSFYVLQAIYDIPAFFSQNQVL